MLVLHAHQRLVLYNNEFHGCYPDQAAQPEYGTTGKKLYRGGFTLVAFQNRTIPAAEGQLRPRYFEYPGVATGSDPDCSKVAAFACWENWNGDCNGTPFQSAKDPEFHGPMVSDNYSETGEQYDVNPNPMYPAQNAPFWDTLGDVSDPTNDKSLSKFLLNNKFIVHTEVPYAIDLKYGCRVYSSVPKTPAVQFSTNNAFLPCPPNWKERNWVFECNSEYSGLNVDGGYNVYYMEMGARDNVSVLYPYAPDQHEVVKNNRTDVGGNVYNGAGAHISSVPDWFKF